MLRSILRSGIPIAIACLVPVAACTDRPAVEPAPLAWRIADIAGTASMRTSPDAAWQPLVAAILAPGAEVVVAPAGRLQLASAGDLVTAESGSRFIVPDAAAPAAGLIQTDGRMSYEVETRGTGRFQVETPFMAITVKGTEFIVEVESVTASVDVAHGVVQVDSYASGQSTDLTAGQSARLDATTGTLVARSAQPGALYEPVAARTADPTRLGRPFTDAGGPGNSAFGHSRGPAHGRAERTAAFGKRNGNVNGNFGGNGHGGGGGKGGGGGRENGGGGGGKGGGK